MALMYFRDGKKFEGGKQWMGKAAARKIIQQKDDIIHNLECALTAVENKRDEVEIELISRTARYRVIIGGLIGYASLLTIIWLSGYHPF